MYSNVKQAKVLSVIAVSSTIGKGTKEDPGREIDEYFTLDGEPLAYRDRWAENTKAESREIQHVTVSHLDHPLVKYVEQLLDEGKISVKGHSGESAFDIALRCWKEDRDKIEKIK